MAEFRAGLAVHPHTPTDDGDTTTKAGGRGVSAPAYPGGIPKVPTSTSNSLKRLGSADIGGIRLTPTAEPGPSAANRLGHSLLPGSTRRLAAKEEERLARFQQCRQTKSIARPSVSGAERCQVKAISGHPSPTTPRHNRRSHDCCRPMCEQARCAALIGRNDASLCLPSLPIPSRRAPSPKTYLPHEPPPTTKGMWEGMAADTQVSR